MRGDTHERRLDVLLYVLEKGFVDVSDLADRFACHVNSIRLDLNALQKSNAPIRLLPGDTAVSLVPVSPSEGLVRRLGARLEEKCRVAKEALKCIQDKDCIFLGGGATSFLLALEIAKSSKQAFSVVTRAFYHWHLLKKVEHFTILGGRAGRYTAMIESTTDVPMLQQLRINKAFLGVDAMSLENGAFCSPFDAMAQHSACLAATDMVVLLTDSSEIGKAKSEGHFASFTELEKLPRPYKIICNKEIEDAEESKKVREELGKFPAGRVVWV